MLFYPPPFWMTAVSTAFLLKYHISAKLLSSGVDRFLFFVCIYMKALKQIAEGRAIAKEALAVQKAKAKETQAVKDKGKQILNSIVVPLAKFEAEKVLFVANNPHHEMTAKFESVFDDGKQIKQEATDAMNREIPCRAGKQEVAAWLAEARQNTKVMQALGKKK